MFNKKLIVYCLVAVIFLDTVKDVPVRGIYEIPKVHEQFEKQKTKKQVNLSFPLQLYTKLRIIVWGLQISSLLHVQLRKYAQ